MYTDVANTEIKNLHSHTEDKHYQRIDYKPPHQVIEGNKHSY